MDSSRPADHELHTDTTAMAAIEADAPRPPARWRMIVYSAIGIVMFFVPVTINGASSIPLDHLVTWVRGLLGPADRWVGLAIIAAGAVCPLAEQHERLADGVVRTEGDGGVVHEVIVTAG